eukprot:1185307-Prorocentrum_minimum.AAC.5
MYYDSCKSNQIAATPHLTDNIFVIRGNSHFAQELAQELPACIGVERVVGKQESPSKARPRQASRRRPQASAPRVGDNAHGAGRGTEN